MTKHTQGPWVIMPRENLPPRIKSKSFGIICKLNDIFPIEKGYQENEANARLIAAAPELLAALELSLEALERWHNSKAASLYGNDSDKARLACINAINKAKGI